MTNAVLLRLHRWLTLIFALPLMVVVVTGLILSFQPIVQTASIRPGSLTQERLEALVRQYDPDSKARGLSINPYDRVLSLDGVGPDGEIDVDLRTGAALALPDYAMEFFDWLEPYDPNSNAERVVDRIQYWMAYLHFGRLGGRGIPYCGRGLCDSISKATWSL